MKLKFAGKSRYAMLATAVICGISGCASAPKEEQVSQVKVYRPGELPSSQYDHVRYLWVDTWRTAFWLPGASSDTEGIAGLQAKAASLGANGLISVTCIDQRSGRDSKNSEPSVLCYGHAIRVH